MYNDYLTTKRLMCNVKMCQVVKSSTLCIYTYIYAYIYYIKRMRDVRSYLFHRSLPNANKKSLKKKRMKKHPCMSEIRITYPVDTQYMPNLPRVWRMDTDVC